MPAEGRGGAASDPARLAAALATLGCPATVETDGALALLRLAPGAALPDAERRGAIVAAARSAGFANVALLLDPPEAP